MRVTTLNDIHFQTEGVTNIVMLLKFEINLKLLIDKFVEFSISNS